MRTSEKTATGGQGVRKRQDRSQKTEARILNAAEQVFGESGFTGAHLAEIAERAGHSIGAVYGRFADKEALFQAVVRRMGERILGEISDEINAVEAGSRLDLAAIRRLIAVLSRNFSRERGLIRAIIERSFEDAPLAGAIRALREEGVSRVRTALERAGIPLRKENLVLATNVIQQMIFGYFILGLLKRQALIEIEDESGLDEMSDAVAAYLGVAE